MSSVAEKVGCLAKYSEDDSWYRGYVEEKSFDTAKVLFVDYGNKEDVSCDKIKELPESMCVLPVQAVKCRLYAVPETAETDAFSALVDGKTLNAQFVAKHFLTKSFQDATITSPLYFSLPNSTITHEIHDPVRMASNVSVFSVIARTARLCLPALSLQTIYQAFETIL
ncbi:hypothetical protein J6590_042398 [Homalodisca vitripennis]|nr:hypothetical protein J6590_042394 [Homalodisca vitripennis]KAG8311527.1 hypothetical protein J6590_042398 [Homalodisca vitripennis]